MKRLIVCCDGTWHSEAARSPSNVWKLYQSLAAQGAGGIVQRRYYQPGLGTDPDRRGLRRTVARLAGGAFGWGLDERILEIYRWLVRQYEPGDELWLLGFSRGAYTARSTAGLLRNCGILRRQHQDMIHRAMKLYRARHPNSHPNAPRSRAFRSEYAHELESIRFLGVWDTVGALGVPPVLGILAGLVNRGHLFHDVQLSSRVQHACHAVAIDERRRAFVPTLWRGGQLESRGGVEQTWFVGVHGDVGGGYTQVGLSDLVLGWMIDRARRCGLAFDPARVAQLQPDPMGTLHDSRWWVHRLPLGLSKSRPMAPGDRQFIHQSALVRLQGDPGYQPDNLTRALAAGMPRRA